MRKNVGAGEQVTDEVVLTRDEKILAGLLFLFMIGTTGAEITYTQMLYVYAQRTLALSNELGTWLVTTFWIGFCVFRTAAIFISRVISPRIYLTVRVEYEKFKNKFL